MEITVLVVLYLLFILAGIAATVFWLWLLIEVVTKEPEEGNDKIVWLLVILVAGPLGAVLYFFIRRPQRITQTGR